MVESMRTQQRDPLLSGLIVLSGRDFFKPTDTDSGECHQIRAEIYQLSKGFLDNIARNGKLTIFSQNAMQDLVSRYNEKCRGDLRTAKQPEPTGHQFEISLPESLNSTVAAVGAEGVRGASTLTPWEAAVVSEAKVMGQTIKEFAAPALVLGLMALGAVQVIQTGNATTFQRAWAMVR